MRSERVQPLLVSHEKIGTIRGNPLEALIFKKTEKEHCETKDDGLWDAAEVQGRVGGLMLGINYIGDVIMSCRSYVARLNNHHHHLTCSVLLISPTRLLFLTLNDICF